MKFLNCIIRGLPEDTTISDVEDHIQAETTCKPYVSTVAPDYQTRSCMSTVTLDLKNNSKEAIVERLNNSNFLGLPTRIHVDTDFYGLNTLSDSEGSNIEYGLYLSFFVVVADDN